MFQIRDTAESLGHVDMIPKVAYMFSLDLARRLEAMTIRFLKVATVKMVNMLPRPRRQSRWSFENFEAAMSAMSDLRGLLTVCGSILLTMWWLGVFFVRG